MLKESEILENSIIVIDYEDGGSKPYYVNTKGLGNVTGATMLLGYLIDDLVSNVKAYGLSKVWPIVNRGQTDRYYIENEKTKGGDNRVKNYRFPTEEEKSEIKELLQSVGLNEAANILTEDKTEPLSVDEIKEKKIIVITDTDNQRKPFYVAFKLATIGMGKTIVMGLPVDIIIKDKVWPIEGLDFLENYFINNNLVAGNPEVKKYSNLTTVENLKLKAVLLNNQLSEVAACID